MERPPSTDCRFDRGASFPKGASRSRDYDHLRIQKPENNYSFINKFQNTSRPTVGHNRKGKTANANSAGNEEQIYYEISDKNCFKCSRCSLLVSIFQFGVIVVCVALLGIYIYKMEMLQKEFLSLNPLAGRCAGVTSELCELLRDKFEELNETENLFAWKEFMDKQDGCSVRFVLRGIHSDNLTELNSRHHVISGWSISSKKYKSRQHCIEPTSDYSHFTVNEGGTYFFFSQLSYFANDDLLTETFKKHLFAGQKVLSNDYELLQQSSLVNVPQLDEGQPMPGCGEDRGTLHVSTLSGIIEVETGDRLSLHACPINWLCRQNDASFFGVYRID